MAKKTRTTKRAAMIRAALEKCRDANGRIIPSRVVEFARPKNSPLHDEFIWNDEEAAELYRLERAQQLIREVKFTVVHEGVSFKTPVYVSDPSVPMSSYVATEYAARSAAMSNEILLDELRRIENAINRARALAAAFDLTHRFNSMLNDLVELRTAVVAATKRRKTTKAEERPQA